MAELAEDPGLYWIEPEARGIIPLDRFHVPRRLARTVAARCLRDQDRQRFRGGDRRLRVGRAGPGKDLDQRAHPTPLWRAVCARPLPYGRSLAGRQAGRRALRCPARRRLLRGKHVHPRARRLEGRARPSRGAAQGRRLPAARHPVHHAAPEAVRCGRCRSPALSSPPRGGDRRQGGFSPLHRRSDRRGDFAVGEPHVVDRVIDRMEPRARGEHPSGEQALDLAGQRDLVDLDERVGPRRLGRRPRIAGARRHLERAELHGLVDIDIEADDPPGDLVQSGEYRDRVVDPLGLSRGGGGHRRKRDRSENREPGTADYRLWRRGFRRLPARRATSIRFHLVPV